MKKFKGTAGPWYVSHPKGERRRFVMANGERIATVAHNRGRTPAKINAHLIAAAPELLEALQELHSAWCELQNSEDGVAVDARAAINKAMGGGE